MPVTEKGIVSKLLHQQIHFILTRHPVSYTHLDVYKRQGPGKRVPFRDPLPESRLPGTDRYGEFRSDEMCIRDR